MDAQTAARALSGLNSAMRYFIALDHPDFAGVEIPIPVIIRKGSWEALIPHDAESWIRTVIGAGALRYFTTAAAKVAEKDFKGVGFSDLFKKALKGVQLLVRIGKHLGHVNFKDISKATWDRLDHDGLVGIPNKKGELLYIADSEFKRLSSFPPKLLSDLASVIASGRILEIGVYEKAKASIESINESDRHIFYSGDDAEVIFPELTHGMKIQVDGTVTRGNEMTNTLGFFYAGHILTCIPASGKIVRFKKNLFLECRIKGEISRFDKKGLPTESKPKIIFSSLKTLSKTP